MRLRFLSCLVLAGCIQVHVQEPEGDHSARATVPTKPSPPRRAPSPEPDHESDETASVGVVHDPEADDEAGRRAMVAAEAREAKDRELEASAERAAEEKRLREMCPKDRRERVASTKRLKPQADKITAEREKRAADKARRAANHEADAAWVHAHCRWENDPRYAIEVERVARQEYVAREVVAGYRASRPTCPPGTSQDRLIVAAEIGSGIVNPQMAPGYMGSVLERVLRDREEPVLREYAELEERNRKCAPFDVP